MHGATHPTGARLLVCVVVMVTRIGVEQCVHNGGSYITDQCHSSEREGTYHVHTEQGNVGVS